MLCIEPPSDSDNAEWRRIHLEQPTLGSFDPEDILLRGWVHKQGEKGLLGKPWSRRYCIVLQHFLVYFKTDSLHEKALGCVYLMDCGVEQLGTFQQHPNAIKLQPIVPRRPGDAITGDSCKFVLSIEDAIQFTAWVEQLRKCSH